ncbi:hypothetical protein IW261DRAFT_1597894 [Armillaria novae-zelandiae]|uniref:Uncharacterized protein n=1 Tax=Armillaria novae-zelandiae TaxID=153914 RepID=A0AA39U7U5_9AGAR|nr:hypothetical protein IW261DRAFT_1597894 [Armillaria novae-zelandiae]
MSTCKVYKPVSAAAKLRSWEDLPTSTDRPVTIAGARMLLFQNSRMIIPSLFQPTNTLYHLYLRVENNSEGAPGLGMQTHCVPIFGKVSVFRGRSSLWVASWHYSNFIVSRLTFTIRLNTPRAASLPEAQMRLVFISTLLALSSYSAAAEDPKPPTTWTVDTLSLVENSQNVTQSWDERISNASASLQQAITMVNQTHGQFNVSNGTYADAGALYAQMVEYDRLTNQTKYKVILRDYFTVAESKNPGFLDVQNYGYAAAHAYTVYQDPFFLTLATTSWASARRYTISQKQADSGTIGTKNFNLSSCHSSLVGGTFSVTDCNDPFLDSLASGMFLV